MKSTVLDIEEVQGWAPVFRNRFGAWFLKKLFRFVGMEQVNQIHARHCNLRGADFTSAMLADPMMNVHYEVHNREILEQLPKGAFITVSNHPIGSLDGIILIDIFARLRPDFHVMVNEILGHISAMSDNFISVKPRTDDNLSENNRNVNGIRLSLEQLHEGHPMGFFPAGAMSFYNHRLRRVCDLPWTHSIIRLIRKAKAPVFPVFFDCLNSKSFYRIGNFSWKLRTLLVCREAFNKQGQTMHVYIGDPITPEKIKTLKDDNSLAEYLYNSTYSAKKNK